MSFVALSSGQPAPVDGQCDPAFKPVREAFTEGFLATAPFSELGAAFAVHDGERLLVDLWGGYCDTARTRPWQQDTLVNVWSTTKGLMALVIAQLVDHGLCDYDARVALYWPEFALGGKQDVTVAQMLSHQAGLNGFVAPTSVADLGNWELVTARLASQAPAWQVGAHSSYHAITFGFLAGELARRITGKSPRALIERDLAAPLGLDMFLGLPVAETRRVSDLLPPGQATIDANSVNSLALPALMNPVILGEDANQPAWRAAQIPAANGHTTARALATLWGMVAGQKPSPALPGPSVLDALRTTRTAGDDLMLGPGAWGAGVMINRTGMFGPGPGAFGHCGWGGSLGFADPDSRVGIGYVMNRMGQGVLHDPRPMLLSALTIDCLGRAGS